MKYDRTKTILQNLLLLINAKAKRTVLEAELTFGNPVAITPAVGNGNNNTEITATFVKGAGNTGAINGSQTTIQYTRLTLANSYPAANRTVNVTGSDSLSTVKSKIASSQRLAPTEFDLSSTTLPTSPGATVVMPVDPIANSKLYIPGTLNLTLNNTDTFTFTGNLLMSGGTLANNSTALKNLKNDQAVTLLGDTKAATGVRRYNSASIFLDGTGDRISIPRAQIGNLLTGDFTIECWIHPTNTAPQYIPLLSWWSQNGTADTGFIIYFASGVLTIYFRPFSLSTALMSYSGVVLNKWTHVAWTRQGSTFRLFVDGALVATATSAATAASINIDYMFGNYLGTTGVSPASGVADFTGYVDQLAVYTGTAKYAAAFNPQPIYNYGAAPISYAGQFLLRSDNLPEGSFDIRNEKNDKLMTRYGDARSRQTQKKYGSGALYLDGTGDWVRVETPNTDIGNLYTGGDFTIEMYIYPESVSGIRSLMSQLWQVSGRLGFHLAIDAGVPKFLFGTVDEVNWMMASDAALAINTWHHVAVTRTGNVFRLFVNGALKATVTNAATGGTPANYPTIPIVLGFMHNSTGTFSPVPNTVIAFQGYMDDVGIQVGTSKYTAAFTPAAIA